MKKKTAEKITLMKSSGGELFLVKNASWRMLFLFPSAFGFRAPWLPVLYRNTKQIWQYPLICSALWLPL